MHSGAPRFLLPLPRDGYCVGHHAARPPSAAQRRCAAHRNVRPSYRCSSPLALGGLCGRYCLSPHALGGLCGRCLSLSVPQHQIIDASPCFEGVLRALLSLAPLAPQHQVIDASPYFQGVLRARLRRHCGLPSVGQLNELRIHCILPTPSVGRPAQLRSRCSDDRRRHPPHGPCCRMRREPYEQRGHGGHIEVVLIFAHNGLALGGRSCFLPQLRPSSPLVGHLLEFLGALHGRLQRTPALHLSSLRICLRQSGGAALSH